MKKTKKAALFIAVGVLALYLCICFVCRVSYNHILNTLIPEEQVLYNAIQSTGSVSDDSLIVYLDDEKIVFRKIIDVYIFPFEAVKIPTIEYQYTYFLADPAKSIFSEKNKEHNLRGKVDGNIFIAKDYRVIGTEAATPQYEAYYFGYCKEGVSLDGVSKYVMTHNVDRGYLFLFYEKENPNFNDTMVNVIYF